MHIRKRALLIDDDGDIGEFVTHVAAEKGWECLATTNAATFIDSLTVDTNLIFVDLVMPDVDGIELLRVLAEVGCEAGIVLMSGVGKRVMETAVEMVQALGLPVVGQLQKPFQIHDVETILNLAGRPAPSTTERASQRTINRITEAELKLAIEQNQFVIHYQPQIDIATAAIVGVEALVRWLHPKWGLIFPDHFITRLEVLGLIDELGRIVAARALHDLARFADTAGSIPTISINVSARSLHDLKFPDTLAALAKGSGVPPEKITIEITESGLINQLARTLDVLTRLRMKAVHLSIDDFGTGYSMMKQLRHIPATELKIDRSFVQQMGLSEGDRIMVQKTIEIGHGLGMKVIAEGVETLEQLAFLRANGCDTAQGYLYSRPLPADAFVLWLQQYRASPSPTPEPPNPSTADASTADASTAL